jgi:hypothetical protein
VAHQLAISFSISFQPPFQSRRWAHIKRLKLDLKPINKRMKRHSYRLMAIIIMVALMGAQETVRATSYSYPFATEFSFKPKLGESIATVLETIYSDFRKRDDLKYVDHTSALLQIDPDLKKVVCTVEREYKGQLGEAIFEFLFDYGCGMEIIDPTRSDGPSYTLRIGRIDPSEKFTVIVPTPDSIRNALNIGGAGLADELRKAGLNDEECSAAKITQNMGQIYATAKMSAIARLWAYTQCAHRQAEHTGAGQPATRPESKSEGSDKPQPEAEGRSR